jgi:hypothetical protein
MEQMESIFGSEDVPDEILASFITEVLAEGNDVSHGAASFDVATEDVTDTATEEATVECQNNNFSQEQQVTEVHYHNHTTTNNNNNTSSFLPVFQNSSVHVNMHVAVPTSKQFKGQEFQTTVDIQSTAVELLGDALFNMDEAEEEEEEEDHHADAMMVRQTFKEDDDTVSLDPLAIARRAETAIRVYDAVTTAVAVTEQQPPAVQVAVQVAMPLALAKARSEKTATRKAAGKTQTKTKRAKKRIGRLGGGPKRVGASSAAGRGSLKSPPLRVLRTTSTKKKHRGVRLSSKQRASSAKLSRRVRHQKLDDENSSMFVEIDSTERHSDRLRTVENIERVVVDVEEEEDDRMDEQRRLYQIRLEQQLELELERQQYMMRDLEHSLNSVNDEERPRMSTPTMMESPSATTKTFQRTSPTLPGSSAYERVVPPTPPRDRKHTAGISTPGGNKATYGGGLSHDSDAWREVMNSERRPRTAPPKGLDRESGIWSNTPSYLINQSYMVGEAPPRPTTQRFGMTVSFSVMF